MTTEGIGIVKGQETGVEIDVMTADGMIDEIMTANGIGIETVTGMVGGTKIDHPIVKMVEEMKSQRPDPLVLEVLTTVSADLSYKIPKSVNPHST